MSINFLFAQVEVCVILFCILLPWRTGPLVPPCYFKILFWPLPQTQENNSEFYLIRILVKDSSSVPQKLYSKYIRTRFCLCLMGQSSEPSSDMIICFKKTEADLGEWLSPTVRVPEIKPGHQAGSESLHPFSSLAILPAPLFNFFNAARVFLFPPPPSPCFSQKTSKYKLAGLYLENSGLPFSPFFDTYNICLNSSLKTSFLCFCFFGTKLGAPSPNLHHKTQKTSEPFSRGENALAGTETMTLDPSHSHWSQHAALEAAASPGTREQSSSGHGISKASPCTPPWAFLV